MTSNLSFLNSKNYRVYHVDLAKKLGSINAAIFLCELVYQTDKFADREVEDKRQYLLRKKGKKWVFLTQEDVEERTAMSRKLQDSAIEVLIKKCLIEKIVVGIPPKRYFWLNEENILTLFGLSKNVSQIALVGQIDLSDVDKLNCPSGTNPHIYKEPELKEPEGGTPPIFSFSYKGNSFIRMPIHNYHDLCQEHGEEKLRKEMEKATDYLASSGSKGKKDYAAFMRNWMKKAEEWQKPKKEEPKETHPHETEMFKKNKQLAEYVQSCYDAQKSDGKYDKIRLNDSFITIYTSEDISTAIPYCDENFSVVLIRLAEYLEIKLRDED